VAQQESFWYTYRKGNWSRPITYHDSPWWGSDEEHAALTGFVPGENDTVIIRNEVTVDVDTTIGVSIQAAIWEPLAISLTDGLYVTQLGEGQYTLAATVTGGRGETQVGNTVSAQFFLIDGQTKPRVTFAQAPPTGCSYNIYLDDPLHPFVRKLYCSNIIAGATSTFCDLVSGRWLAHSTNENAAQNGTADYVNSSDPLPSGQTSAITITAYGSLIVAAGKRLTALGDIVVESPKDSKTSFIQVGKGATIETDNSSAVDLLRANYLVWFHGGGSIQFLS
jgi:hypothetical protein